MIENCEIEYEFLDEESNISNHSSIHHKGRIELKTNKFSIQTEEAKKKRNIWYRKGQTKRKKHKELKIYTDGKKHLTEEQIKKISSNHADFRGENNPMWGKKHSPETIKLLKEICRDMKGENNPMYGKIHTEETKQKMTNKKNKPLLVAGRFFKSIKDARKNVVISIKDLKEKITEGVPGYKLLDKNEIKQYI